MNCRIAITERKKIDAKKTVSTFGTAGPGRIKKEAIRRFNKGVKYVGGKGFKADIQGIRKFFHGEKVSDSGFEVNKESITFHEERKTIDDRPSSFVPREFDLAYLGNGYLLASDVWVDK